MIKYFIISLILLSELNGLQYGRLQVTLLPNFLPFLPFDSFIPHKIASWYEYAANALFYSDKDECTVQVKQGVIHGLYRDSYRQFLGIPYAQAPSGNQRWRSPVKLKSFDNGGTHDAKQYGDCCHQIHNEPDSWLKRMAMGPRSNPSEACLNLNIWTPRAAKLLSKVPVIVFIHGGAFSSGSNSIPLYEPIRMVEANENVIVVSINYRLGVFGFLASLQLQEEVQHTEKGFGNYGIEDQILALQWIQENIEAFGGDASNVTLMGHSAGAISINYLLFALNNPQYRNERLFKRAFLQSGTVDTWRKRSLNDTLTLPTFEKILSQFKCKDLSCLRAVDATELNQFMIQEKWDLLWGPVIDYKLVKDFPQRLMEMGDYLQDIELVFTSTKDDGVMFVPYQIETETDFKHFVGANFGGIDQKVLSRYKHKDFMTLSSHIIRDCLFRCPAIRIGSAFAKTNPSYYMEFKDGISAASILTRVYYGQSWGAFHGSELISLFEKNKHIMTVKERAFAKSIQKIWIEFASTGEFNSASKTDQRLPFKMDPFFKCEFWDQNSFAFPDFAML